MIFPFLIEISPNFFLDSQSRHHWYWNLSYTQCLQVPTERAKKKPSLKKKKEREGGREEEKVIPMHTHGSPWDVFSSHSPPVTPELEEFSKVNTGFQELFSSFLKNLNGFIYFLVNKPIKWPTVVERGPALTFNATFHSFCFCLSPPKEYERLKTGNHVFVWHHFFF